MSMQQLVVYRLAPVVMALMVSVVAAVYYLAPADATMQIIAYMHVGDERGGDGLRLHDVETGLTLSLRPRAAPGDFAVQIRAGPAWSPDGRALLLTGTFGTWADVREGTYILTPFTGAFDPVTIRPGIDLANIERVITSPDGRYLAYIMHLPGARPGTDTYQLLVYDMLEDRVITAADPGQSAFYTPRWSPDSRRIAYERYVIGRRSSERLYVFDLETETSQRIPIDLEEVAEFGRGSRSLVVAEPHWDHTGQLLYYRMYSRVASGPIVALNMESGDKSYLRADGNDIYAMAVPAPTDNRVALVVFRWDENNRFVTDIYVLAGDERRLLFSRNELSLIELNWSPSGEALLIETYDRKLVVLDAVSGEQLNHVHGYAASWRP